MITKNDCLLLLSEIEATGIDVKEICTHLIKTNSIDLETLKFIDKYRPFQVSQFYEYLRKNYNDKKSKLYKEIVQIDQKLPKDVIVTLSSLLTQIFLYSNKLEIEDQQSFLNHSRADEILKVLLNYVKTSDSKLGIQLLHLIKTDLKILEEARKK